ncbi:MAG: hypothetical protein VX529_03815 [Pseudomonadota bacterium]|nr:hypothetical protein [Pseudomonadota bacterium]
MSKLAEKLGVSGSYLARICDQLNVPRPSRGYWAKLAVGKAPPAPPLPEAHPGDPVTWEPGQMPVLPRQRPRAPASEETRPRVRLPRNKTHPLLLGIKAHFEKTRSRKALAYLRPYKKLLPDITTTPARLDAALSLTNDLFNALTSAGYRVVFAPQGAGLQRPDIEVREEPATNPHHERLGHWTPHRPTVVYVGTIAIGLAVVETSEQALVRYINGDYVREADYKRMSAPDRMGHGYTWTSTRDTPSGRLRIVAYSPYWRVPWTAAWNAAGRKSLPSQLKDIVGEIEEAARALVPRLEEAERQAEIERQEREAAFERYNRQEDARRVEEARQESQEQLANVIQSWSRRMDIEHFFAGVAERAEALPPEECSRVLQRLALAREFLGSVDPMDAFLEWKAPEERYQSKYK